MTVQELIDVLKRYPKNYQVLVDGYEGQYTNFSVRTGLFVEFDFSEYFGEYDEIKYQAEERAYPGAFGAVVLERDR
jgi:hypothetical protein